MANELSHGCYIKLFSGGFLQYCLPQTVGETSSCFSDDIQKLAQTIKLMLNVNRIKYMLPSNGMKSDYDPCLYISASLLISFHLV